MARPKYTGERTYGLDKCPHDYEVLRIRVTAQQNYDMYPTLTKSELYADDYKFLAPSKPGADVSATDAALREIRQTANGIKAGRIPPPKATLVEMDNVLAYLILTEQLERAKAWQVTYGSTIRNTFKKYGPLTIRLCDCSDLMPRQWTGDVLDWRKLELVQKFPDMTLIEDGTKLKRLYKQTVKRKMELLNDR